MGGKTISGHADCRPKSARTRRNDCPAVQNTNVREGNRLMRQKKRLGAQLFDEKLVKFLCVGVVNTLVGMAIMFGLYNLAGCSYWISSAANYILTSILSYFLNKLFTFRNRDGIGSTALRFAVNIAVCYLLAYGIAKPLTAYVLSGAPAALRDNCSMLVGMVLFTALNYFGQRFFAFRSRET